MEIESVRGNLEVWIGQWLNTQIQGTPHKTKNEFVNEKIIKNLPSSEEFQKNIIKVEKYIKDENKYIKKIEKHAIKNKWKFEKIFKIRSTHNGTKCISCFRWLKRNKYECECGSKVLKTK